MAFFAAVVVTLLKRGSDCPKVLATTHFHELFSDKVLTEAMPIHYVHMEVMVSQVDKNGRRRVLAHRNERCDTDTDSHSEEVSEAPTEGSVQEITYLYRCGFS